MAYKFIKYSKESDTIELYQLAYPYTSGNTSFGHSFVNATFGEPTIEQAYGGSYSYSLSTVDATISIADYGKLYYFKGTSIAAVEVPHNTQLYVAKAGTYYASSAPHKEGDSTVMNVGGYDSENNTIVFNAQSRQFVAASWGNTSDALQKLYLYALIDDTYRRVYVLTPNGVIQEEVRVSDAKIGSFTSHRVVDGYEYTYMTSNGSSVGSNVGGISPIKSLYWGENLYYKKTLCEVVLYGSYLYLFPTSNYTFIRK